MLTAEAADGQAWTRKRVAIDQHRRQLQTAAYLADLVLVQLGDWLDDSSRADHLFHPAHAVMVRLDFGGPALRDAARLDGVGIDGALAEHPVALPTHLADGLILHG